MGSELREPIATLINKRQRQLLNNMFTTPVPNGIRDPVGARKGIIGLHTSQFIIEKFHLLLSYTMMSIHYSEMDG